jgi:transposase
VGSRRDCAWILGLPGFRVVTTTSDGDAVDSRLTIRIERRGVQRYRCSGCGRGTSRVRSARDRTWDDVPWASHPVTLVYVQRRVHCRHCGIRTEEIEFADSKARVTRRLRQQIGEETASPHAKQSISALRESLPNPTLAVLERQEHNAIDGGREVLATAIIEFAATEE